jgi:hypothetical protein
MLEVLAARLAGRQDEHVVALTLYKFPRTTPSLGW